MVIMLKKLFSRKLTELPIVGEDYHHKDRDPMDMISHVVPQYVEEGEVTYIKFYKDPSISPANDKASIAEFNQWYRKGV